MTVLVRARRCSLLEQVLRQTSIVLALTASSLLSASNPVLCELFLQLGPDLARPLEQHDLHDQLQAMSCMRMYAIEI